MSDDVFELLEQTLRSDGPQAGFDLLAQRFRDEKNYPLLFEARLMKKRHDLGLPLIPTQPFEDLPEDVRQAYDAGSIEAAREVGSLFLADGDIQRAWPYFRAIGEPAPVGAAIEKIEQKEGIDAVIEIAFYERVHPRKGFELILANHGICRAITSFGHYPSAEGRQESARLLVRTLHADLAENLKRAIAQQEERAPATESISELIAGRDWLFEGNSYYIDTSHVSSVVQIGKQLTDRESLVLLLELTDYGKRLAPLFQFRGEPPFENVYEDHAVYLRALLGEDVDGAIAHFEKKVADSDPKRIGTAPAEVLVGLLIRVGRHQEAIEASLKYLGDSDPNHLSCPSVLQLCELAGDYERLGHLARERGDLLSFTAASLRKQPVPSK